VYVVVSLSRALLGLLFQKVARIVNGLETTSRTAPIGHVYAAGRLEMHFECTLLRLHYTETPATLVHALGQWGHRTELQQTRKEHCASVWYRCIQRHPSARCFFSACGQWDRHIQLAAMRGVDTKTGLRLYYTEAPTTLVHALGQWGHRTELQQMRKEHCASVRYCCIQRHPSDRCFFSACGQWDRHIQLAAMRGVDTKTGTEVGDTA